MYTNEKLVRSTKNVRESKKERDRERVSGSKKKMTKVARHSDLFHFFCADFSFYFVFHLTIIRCSILLSPCTIPIFCPAIISDISLFVPGAGAAGRVRKRVFRVFRKYIFPHYSNSSIHDEEK